MKIGDYFLGAGLLHKIVDEKDDKFIVIDMTMVDEFGNSYGWKERTHKSIVEQICRPVSKEEAEQKIHKLKIDALHNSIKLKKESIQDSKTKLKKLKKELEKVIK